jgi:hypothetical protein
MRGTDDRFGVLLRWHDVDQDLYFLRTLHKLAHEVHLVLCERHRQPLPFPMPTRRGRTFEFLRGQRLYLFPVLLSLRGRVDVVLDREKGGELRQVFE